MDNVVRRRPSADPAYPGSRVMRCAFTGYRPQKMEFGFDELDPRCIDFKERLYETIESLIWSGYSHFLSGGALGMDMYAAEIVLELRQQYPWIGLEMVIPFDAQPDNWNELYKARYGVLLEEADIVTFTSHAYTKGALFQRNRYLVDNADLLLAAYDGKPGGTQMTCNYARKIGIQVCEIRPVLDRPVKAKQTEVDEEDAQLFKGDLTIFGHAHDVQAEPGKTYTIDCPFCKAADGLDFALSSYNNHLHAHCRSCSMSVMQ